MRPLLGEADPSVPATDGGLRTWQLFLSSAPHPRFHLFWGDPSSCLCCTEFSCSPALLSLGSPCVCSADAFDTRKVDFGNQVFSVALTPNPA